MSFKACLICGKVKDKYKVSESDIKAMYYYHVGFCWSLPDKGELII